MKPRFFLFVIIICAVVIAIIIALAGSQPPLPEPTPNEGTVSVTVYNNIGVKDIEIENLNTGKKYIATLIGLPISFNCTAGDHLKLRVVVQEGYRWNAWWFLPMDIFNHDNPATIPTDGKYTSEGQMVLRPDTLIIDVPTPTPTYTPPPE